MLLYQPQPVSKGFDPRVAVGANRGIGNSWEASKKHRDVNGGVPSLLRHVPVLRETYQAGDALNTYGAYLRYKANVTIPDASVWAISQTSAHDEITDGLVALGDALDATAALFGALMGVAMAVGGVSFLVGMVPALAIPAFQVTFTSVIIAEKATGISLAVSGLSALVNGEAAKFMTAGVKKGMYSEAAAVSRFKIANASLFDALTGILKLPSVLGAYSGLVSIAGNKGRIALHAADPVKHARIVSLIQKALKIFDSAAEVIDKINEFVENCKKVYEYAKAVGKAVIDGVKAGVKFVGEKIVQGVEKTKEFVESLPGRAKKGFLSFANWGRKALNSAADNAQEYFKDKSWLPAGALGALGGSLLGPTIGGAVGGVLGGLAGGAIGLFAGGPLGALAGMGIGANLGAGVGAAVGGVVGPMAGAMLATSAKAIPSDGDLTGPFFPGRDHSYFQGESGLGHAKGWHGASNSSRRMGFISPASIVYVNGINTSIEEHHAAAQHLATASNQTVIGIYNGSGIATSGAAIGVVRDLLQCLSDKAGDIGRFIGRGNPAIKTLVGILKDRGDPKARDGGLNIVAHSQGSIVVSEALRQARLQNANIQGHNITTFGNAAFTFPAGPNYEHNVHDDDLVSTTSGSTSVFSKLLNTRLSGLSWLFSGDNDDPRKHTRVTHSGKSGIDPHDVHGYIEEWKKNRENPQQAAPVGNVDVRRSAYASTYALARAIGSGVLSKSKSVLSASDRIMAKYAMPQDKMIYFGLTSPAMHGAGRLLERGGNWISRQIDRGFTNWGPQRQGSGIYDPSNPDALRAMLVAQSGSGSSLSKDKRSELAPHLGFDPSHARLHSGPDAARAASALNAEAFTIGSDVFFGEGRYSPNTKEGMGLLAHELTHVGQQTGVFGKETRFYSQSGGDEMEREAQDSETLLQYADLSEGLLVDDIECMYESDSDQELDESVFRRLRSIQEIGTDLVSRRCGRQSVEISDLTVSLTLDLERMSDEEIALEWAARIIAEVESRMRDPSYSGPGHGVQTKRGDKKNPPPGATQNELKVVEQEFKNLGGTSDDIEQQLYDRTLQDQLKTLEQKLRSLPALPNEPILLKPLRKPGQNDLEYQRQLEKYKQVENSYEQYEQLLEQYDRLGQQYYDLLREHYHQQIWRQTEEILKTKPFGTTPLPMMGSPMRPMFNGGDFNDYINQIKNLFDTVGPPLASVHSNPIQFKHKSKTALSTSAEIAANQVERVVQTGHFSDADIAMMDPSKRLVIAGRRGAAGLPAELRSHVEELVSPESLKLMAGVLGLWGASHLAGIGQAADITMLGLGALFLGTELFQVGQDLGAYYNKARNAKSDEDFTQAGKHLAKAVSTGGIDTILALLTKGVKKGKAPKASQTTGAHTYNMVENPGPLARIFPEHARTFAGGRYNAIRLEGDLKVYRAGAADSGGQYFSRTKPISEMQVRRDFAVERTWNDPRSGAPTGLSQIEGYQEIIIPKGTIIYEGPAASRGGYFSGGNEQIFIPRQDVPTDPSRVKWIPWR
ncbi:MAG TPA: DUF4157 domain-containing protein [Fimbriimonadaceae bacterium]|nr:DUF4157 domain-containing protein [Fimbriimonadaceae bacterium]